MINNSPPSLISTPFYKRKFALVSGSAEGYLVVVPDVGEIFSQGFTEYSVKGSKDSVEQLQCCLGLSNLTRLLSTRELVLSEGGTVVIFLPKPPAFIPFHRVPEHSVVP
jgi:hypothetical protein